jgi:Na+/proline symporter
MAAVVAVGLPEVDGLANLFTHPNVIGKLNLLPDFNDPSALIPILIIPIAVQWWSVWYPGAEPGGGGYLVQRMLSAKNEKNAMGATLFFNAAHYALRPWPWIIVALASLIIYPDLAMLAEKFPHVNPGIIKHDLAYPAMLTFLPRGILGIVVASLIAAYMSTMASHLNWGSSYVVNDFYKRFVKPDATDTQQVMVGRISTVVLMILAGAVALLLSNALQAFHILLQIGAGTGLIFILRWFWRRINAYTEITGMVVSFFVALYLEVIHAKLGFEPFPAHINLVIGVSITTPIWLIVTLLTKPASDEVLRNFYTLVRPGGIGWKKMLAKAEQDGAPIEQTATKGDLPLGILCMIAGCLAVYSTVFAAGFYLYGNLVPALITTILALVAITFLVRTWGKLEMK